MSQYLGQENKSFYKIFRQKDIEGTGRMTKKEIFVIFRSNSIKISMKQFFLILDIGDVPIDSAGRFDYRVLLEKLGLM